MWNNREGWRLKQIDNERGREGGKGKERGGGERQRGKRETETPQHESPGYLIIQSPALDYPS